MQPPIVSPVSRPADEAPEARLQLWLDNHALGEDAFAEAYESLDGKERAVLKKCIARQHQVWGELPVGERRARAFHQGFGLEEDCAPASWCLLVCERDYASPAAFLAALLPGLLAGVERMLPCFTPGPSGAADAPPSAPLLAALELAGVEQAFAAPEAAILELLPLLPLLSDGAGPGRLLILGKPGFGGALALAAHANAVPCRSFTRPPRYFNARLGGGVEQRFIPAGDPPSDFTDGEEGLFLHLDEGHEDVWFWPDLDPQWFRVRRMRLYKM